MRGMVIAAVWAVPLLLGGCQPAADTSAEANVGRAADAQADAAETLTAEPGNSLVPVQGQDAETRSGRSTVTTSSATIDWDAARTDFASRRSQGESPTFQIASGAEAPPVPVLLPSGIVQPANAARPRFGALDDGYFAKYPGLDYDITISGTNEWYSGGADARAAPADEMVFTQTMTGAQIALNRYGAAYLIEFECNGTAGAMGGRCIDEAEALSVAEALVIAGTR